MPAFFHKLALAWSVGYAAGLGFAMSHWTLMSVTRQAPPAMSRADLLLLGDLTRQRE